MWFAENQLWPLPKPEVVEMLESSLLRRFFKQMHRKALKFRSPLLSIEWWNLAKNSRTLPLPEGGGILFE